MSKLKLLKEDTGALRTLIGAAQEGLGDFYTVVKASFKGIFRSWVYWARVHFPLTPFRSGESYRNMARNYDNDMNRIYGELDSAMSRLSISNGTVMLMNPMLGLGSLLADASVAYNSGDMGQWFETIGLKDILISRSQSSRFEGTFDYLDEKNPDALKERWAKIVGITTTTNNEYFGSIFGSIQRLFLLDFKADSRNIIGNVLSEAAENSNSIEELKKELFMKHLQLLGIFDKFEEVGKQFLERKKQYVSELLDSVEEANRIGSGVLESKTPEEFRSKISPLIQTSKSESTKKLDINKFVQMANQEFDNLKKDKKKYKQIAKQISEKDSSVNPKNIDQKIMEHIFTASRSDFANVIGESMKSTYEELKQIITANLNKSQEKILNQSELGKKYLEWKNISMKRLDDSLTISDSLQKS